MLIDDNGKYREMTPEEVKAMEEAQNSQPPSPPSPEQEIAELKRQNEEMRRMIETRDKMIEDSYNRGVEDA